MQLPKACRYFRNCSYLKGFIRMISDASTIAELEDQKQANDLQNLIYVDKMPYTVVTEGKAEVLFPSSHDVFYNPVQEFNRDLSIAVLKQVIKESAFVNLRDKSKQKDEAKPDEQRPVRILEALAASGLRSIRFAKEIESNLKILANDRDRQAFSSMQRNVKHNKVEDVVEPCNEDASLLMYKNRCFKDRFDVVDLDPYGTAAPFLDAAVQCVADGGLLMVTCTDMAVLCGNGIEACHAKYGAISAKSSNCHEMALRIVLQSIESHANRYGRYIQPLLSLSVDFYVRLFVRIFTSPKAVKESVCKLSLVYICPTCGSFYLQPLGNKLKTDKGEKYTPAVGPPVNKRCDICNCSYKVCGPIWSSKLHDKEFVEEVVQMLEQEQEQYKTYKRMIGILTVVLEELEDCPLYHKIPCLASTVHVVSPTNNDMRSAILNAGYRVSISHASPISIKTDAPQEVIWDIIKAWAKQHPGKKTFENEPSKTIMSNSAASMFSFDPHPDAEPKSRTNNLLRFQVNPTSNWGPKCRATTSLFEGKEGEKRKRYQNKRQKKDSEDHEAVSKKIKVKEESNIDNCIK
ncbi:tRNA (guanine(26)-N(2))-dimethyltransferase-like [Uloborus diversus]|uniref:tRNA (guanine(26)-N(2))-dimethyltransferase-like n=1 Tax=Uloborus diversus TaxID=327109 RepID=UPI0024098A60|nr:tRNA (guanine(26)-N(2))-dimethyltransferase-like [Uloborus diversus]